MSKSASVFFGDSRVKASFDPVNMYLEISEGENLPREPSIRDLALNPTVFHELVHSWQLFAFTSGYLTAAIRPIQSMVAPDIIRGHRKIIKPIIRAVEHDVMQVDEDTESAVIRIDPVRWSEDSPLFGAHTFYFDFEKLNAVLVGWHAKDRDRFILEALPLDMSYDAGVERALLQLVSTIRITIAENLKPLRWPGKRDLIESVKETAGAFEGARNWTTSRSIGIAAIQEGHARFLEMQLIASQCADRNDFGFFVDNGYWSDRYTTAYKAFLEWSCLSAPSSVLDWRVHLFILVCEYALNPTAPYLDVFELNTLFDQFHPAHRFKTACLALKELPSLSPDGAIDLRFMKSAFEAIEEAARPKWARPLAEALQTVELFARQFCTFDLPVEFHFYNLTARHLSTVLLRRMDSSVHLTPLAMVLDFTTTIPFLLPPAISLESRMTFPDVAVRTNRRSSAYSYVGYFVGLVYCDLVDQLFRSSRQFTYDYPMIPAFLKPRIIDTAKSIFESRFGIPISDVQILP